MDLIFVTLSFLIDLNLCCEVIIKNSFFRYHNAIVRWSVRNKTQIANSAGRYFSPDDSEEFWRLAYAGLELQDQDKIVGIEPYFLPGSSADNLISFGEGRCLPGD
ncbi:hypothetical protein J6590_047040 [Homalodisca vitripennis]|nr:hypothetical protein J6590_047040 [Homalodisca vitripennis]